MASSPLRGRDLALLYRITAGPDGSDTEVQPVPIDGVPELELKDLRITFAPTFNGFPVAADIRAAVEELEQQLKPLCAAVEEATLPALDFNPELLNAGELIGMAFGAFQPGEQERPTTRARYLEALTRVSPTVSRPHSIVVRAIPGALCCRHSMYPELKWYASSK